MLKTTFWTLLSQFAVPASQVAACWDEIVSSYSAPGRHYHNLEHLSFMLSQLEAVREQVSDWSALLFSLYYHDVVYDVQAKDNEARSALYAVQRMITIGVPEVVIERCTRQIHATKDHQAFADRDTGLFIDADLAILGQEWPAYLNYSKNVRKEYAIYPDVVYQTGRKAVLLHFLEMDRIFKTEYFFDRLEKQARKNLQQEYDLL